MADKSLAMFLEEKLNLGENINIHSHYYNTERIDDIAEKYELDELIKNCLTSKEYKAIFSFLKDKTSHSITRVLVECTIENSYYIPILLDRYTPYKHKLGLFKIISDSEEIRNDLVETFSNEVISYFTDNSNPKEHIEVGKLMDAYIKLAINMFAWDVLEIVSTTFMKEDKN